MGADIYFVPDKESEERFINEQGNNGLPPLPDSRLFGLGSFPLLVHGVSCLADRLRSEPSDSNDGDLYLSYLDLIQNRREEAIAASDKHMAFVGSWLDASNEGSFTVATPDDISIDKLVATRYAPDARVLCGKLLFLHQTVTRENCELVAAATLWVFSKCKDQLASPLPEDKYMELGLELTQHVMRSLGLHAMYVLRYGGKYIISI